MLEENKKRHREYSPHRSETNDHKHDHRKRERREHERVHQYHKTEHTKSDRQKSEHGKKNCLIYYFCGKTYLFENYGR